MSQIIKVFGGRSRRSYASLFMRSSIPIARTNVLSSSGSSVNNSTGFIKIPNNSVEGFIDAIKECRSYQEFDLIQNIVGLIKDYLENQFEDLSTDTLVFPDNEELTKEVNETLRNIEFPKLFKNSIKEVVYYGSKGYFISELSKRTSNGSTKIKLVPLKNPYSILNVILTNKDKNNDFNTRAFYNIPDSDDGLISKENLLVIGVQDFKLEGGTNYLGNKGITQVALCSTDTSKTSVGSLASDIIENTSIYSARPLFYSVLSDIKNYIVYKTLSSVLAVKDAIVPSFLKLGIELTKASSTNGINDTVNQIESKINESIDASLVLGETLQIDQIINMIFSGVRVLPDPGNLLSSLDSLNLDPLKEKFDQVESKIEECRKTIFESLGIPEDLFDGGSNQYEVFTRNQRYQSTINSFTGMLNITYKENALKLIKRSRPDLYKKYKKELSGGLVRIFKPSPIEMDIMKELLDKNRELASGISDVIEAYTRLMNDNDVIVKDECLKLLKDTISAFGSKYTGLIVDKLPESNEESEY